MRLVKALIVSFLVQLSSAAWRDIVANEDTLVNTCTDTCEDVGVLDHQPQMLERNCKVVKDCKRLSYGWTRGFVRCDYCQCKCEDSRPVIPEVVKVTEKKELLESSLFGTCTGTCHKPGLVRTNFDNCKEVRDCRMARKGWLRWFVRCDYCLCQCVNHKLAASYTLTNVKYELDMNAAQVGKPTALKRMFVENSSNRPQTVNRLIAFEYTNSVEVTTSASLTMGLSVTVEASAGVEGVASTKTAITASMEAGFSSSMGEVKSKTHSDSLEAIMEVGPNKQCEMVVVGNVMNLDVPFSADIITEYDDGSTSSKKTTGIFTGVETSQFRVQYKECISI